MFRTALAAALVASAIAAAHHERVFDRVGLLGSCAAVAPPMADGGQWLECRPGYLTGDPDLSQDACTAGAKRGAKRYWRCPTALVGGRSSDETPTR